MDKGSASSPERLFMRQKRYELKLFALVNLFCSQIGKSLFAPSIIMHALIFN